MFTLYLISVWLHVMTATIWVGGLFFLMLVVVPWLRSGTSAEPSRLLRETAGRFRTVAWACFAILLVTGTFNLWMRGVRPADFASAGWIVSPFGSVVVAKLVVFLALVLLSARHDFVIGPKAASAIQAAPDSPVTARLRREASLHGRINALLALVLVALAVMIVRGRPW
jgi:putative copper resistance protein D